MIGLLDCNNFFVSCERLFRPDLVSKPVIVLSSNDGCVVARSQEIKDMGIPMGVPFFQIKDMVKKLDISVFSSNFDFYRNISYRVMLALKEEVGVCDKYSIDEAFFEVPDASHTAEDFVNMRERIIQKTGIPVSIGLSKTRTLAKIANTYAKKGSGVCILSEEDWVLRMGELSCGSVWGIGREMARKLAENNIQTVGDFLACPERTIRELLGVSGARIFHELSGVPTLSHVLGKEHVPETYMSTRSFGAKTHAYEVLESALTHHITSLAHKLRKNKHFARSMTVICRGGRFDNFAHRKGSSHVVFVYPTYETQTLLRYAQEELERLYDSEIPYKKAGIILGGIIPCTHASPSFFVDETLVQKERAIDTVVDMINSRHASGKVVRGVSLVAPVWESKKEMISPAYTTNWRQIPCVKAS